MSGPNAATTIDIVDTHCHLGRDDEPVAATLERARAAGVTGVVDIGIDAATTLAAQARANAFEAVWFSAGLHPCDADRLDADWATVAAAATDPRCVAIGETGFDFHWDRSSPDAQRRAFERHLELARSAAKPVVVHCRDAFDATFEVIAAHADVQCVLHCFAGGVAEARRALDLGCLLSFAGPVTYPRAEDLRAAAAFAPAERILVETDAPFLPPQPRRGQRNEPAWIVATAERLAAVRGIDLATLAEITTTNARRLFGF